MAFAWHLYALRQYQKDTPVPCWWSPHLIYSMKDRLKKAHTGLMHWASALHLEMTVNASNKIWVAYFSCPSSHTSFKCYAAFDIARAKLKMSHQLFKGKQLKKYTCRIFLLETTLSFLLLWTRGLGERLVCARVLEALTLVFKARGSRRMKKITQKCHIV